MKKAFLTVALAAALFVNVLASTEKILLADETECKVTEKSLIITSSNEKMIDELIKNFGVVRYSVTIKRDRMGAYKEYRATLKPEELNRLKAYFDAKAAKVKSKG